MGVSSVANTANIHSAIAAASRKTGIDFHYLLGQAQVESGMRADARSGSSSATGLYQFVEQSWLSVVKQHGADHGLGWAAASIQQTSSGRYTVGDPATRRAILALRNDPEAAANMAAEHASDNKDALEPAIGREANGTDLYMAHFLGLGGARSFLTAMARNPSRSGASMFPAAARANRGIFYNAHGQPRSLADIYQRFAGKLDQGAAAVGDAAEAVSAPLPAAWREALGGDGDVIVGNGAEMGDTNWINTTLANLNTLRDNNSNPLRPTPETAKLAYMMLASLGA